MAGPKPDRSKGRHQTQAEIGRGAAGGEYIRDVASVRDADDVVAQAAEVLAAGGPVGATGAPPPIFSPAALPGDVVLAPPVDRDRYRPGERLRGSLVGIIGGSVDCPGNQGSQLRGISAV